MTLPLEAAKQGDAAAIEAVLGHHYSQVWSLCRRLCGNDSDAADATQEALLAIVKGLPSFDGRSQLSTWIYRVASNAAIDEIRRARRRPQPTEAIEDIGRTDQHPVESVGVDTQIDIGRALDQLRPEFRRAFVLREVAQLDYQSIAEQEGVPLGTVRSRIARARRHLSEIMGTGNYSGSVTVETNDYE